MALKGTEHMTVQKLAMAIAILLITTPASSKTCEELAAACVKQAGHAACFEQNRMKICKSTNVYTAPDGKSSVASKPR